MDYSLLYRPGESNTHTLLCTSFAGLPTTVLTSDLNRKDEKWEYASYPECLATTDVLTEFPAYETEKSFYDKAR